MPYKSLYRVYRPKTFDEVYGQNHITDILKNQVAAGKTSHAYLFCGPRGTGKTSTAKIFAAALNCLNPKDGNPCLECEACLAMAADAFVDIVEIDAASNNGVDNVRDIRDKVSLLPAQGKFKVYIIDEVHMLSAGAFNALLKTLEEPPPHAVFILATTELRKVPATIMSRCQRYDFKRISEDDIVARLEFVAKEDGVEYEPEALKLIAQQSEGALRDALSIMDQCISSGGRLDEPVVAETVGIADRVRTDALAQAVLAEDAGAAVKYLNEMLADGISAHNIHRDLIAALSQELAESAANVYKSSSILRSLEALIASQTDLRYSSVPNAVLLAAVVRASVNTADADTKDLEGRLKKLEDRVDRMARAMTSARQPAAQIQTPAAAAPAPAKSTSAQLKAALPKKDAPAAPSSPLPDGEELLKKLRDALMEKNMTLVPSIDAVNDVEIRGGSIILKASRDDEALVNVLLSDSCRETVSEAVKQAAGRDARLEVNYEALREQAPAPENNDDISSELIEIFGEENVEIIE